MEKWYLVDGFVAATVWCWHPTHHQSKLCELSSLSDLCLGVPLQLYDHRSMPWRNVFWSFDCIMMDRFIPRLARRVMANSIAGASISMSYGSSFMGNLSISGNLIRFRRPLRAGSKFWVTCLSCHEIAKLIRFSGRTLQIDIPLVVTVLCLWFVSSFR